MKHLPPGPSFGALQTVRYLRDPYAYYEDCARRYGDPFTVPGLAVGSIVVTGDPEGVREVFSADPDSFVPFAPHVLGPLIGETSVLHVSGAQHRKDRRLLSPPFRAQRMRAYGRLFHDIVEDVIREWRAGQEFSLHEVTQAISLEIIIQAVFGAQDAGEVRAFREASTDMMKALVPSILFFPFLRRGSWFGPWNTFDRARARFDRLVYDAIARRRASGERSDDVLSMLLDARYDDGEPMSEELTRHQLTTLLVAGHETTGIALCWVLYYLLRSPEDMQRVLAELAADGSYELADIAELPFLDAVCNETLRLHPIFPDTRRRVARPFVLRGYELPIGTAISIAPQLVHRRHDLYPSPSEFRPQRFLGSKPSPFEFIPFGGGARRCLGAAFALYEMKVVLASILRAWKMSLVDPSPVEPVRRNITMMPRGGVPVRLLGRRPEPARELEPPHEGAPGR